MYSAPPSTPQAGLVLVQKGARNTPAFSALVCSRGSGFCERWQAGVDRTRLAKLIVEGYLLQILRYGLFHADPHPGNIAVRHTSVAPPTLHL
eukprot:4614403-Pyramimonas_sp.AAC.1